MHLLLPVCHRQLMLQVFPLRQAALSNHKLRVKLVGLHKASLLSEQHNFAPDVYDLGKTMLWIITNGPIAADSTGRGIADPPTPMSKSPLASSGQAAGQSADVTKACLEALRSYDPSLLLLLEWMTDPVEGNRADMMDVLRHP